MQKHGSVDLDALLHSQMKQVPERPAAVHLITLVLVQAARRRFNVAHVHVDDLATSDI